MGLFDWIKRAKRAPAQREDSEPERSADAPRTDPDYVSLPGGDSPGDAAGASPERAGELAD